MKIAIGINGACGRMGQRLAQLAHADPELELRAALEAPGHPQQGRDLGEVIGLGSLGVTVTSFLPPEQRLQVLIDFSTPEGTRNALALCRERHVALVVATTGHTPRQKREIEEAGQHIPLLYAPNMSLAMNVLMKLVRLTAEALRGRDFDVEIVEKHHRFKKDAPSGTALHLARILQEVLGPLELRHGREGLTGERAPQELGIHALRVGDNVGEHTILFSTLGETLELSHRAHSRDCYARGALQAAKFLAGQPPGLYSMNNVLGL